MKTNAFLGLFGESNPQYWCCQVTCYPTELTSHVASPSFTLIPNSRGLNCDSLTKARKRLCNILVGDATSRKLPTKHSASFSVAVGLRSGNLVCTLGNHLDMPHGGGRPLNFPGAYLSPCDELFFQAQLAGCHSCNGPARCLGG